MKKIAELIIGSQIVNYEEQGTPTAFISYDSEHHEYKAYCAVCNSISYFNWRLNEDEFYCPVCGHHHHQHPRRSWPGGRSRTNASCRRRSRIGKHPD